MRPIYKLALASTRILVAALVLLWRVGPAFDRTRGGASAAKSIGAHGTAPVSELQRIRSRTDAWSRVDDLPGPLALNGTVVDDHARPVAGAVNSLSSQPPRSVTTAADGTWAVAELLPRPYKLEAHKDDAFARLGNIVPTDGARSISLRLVPGAEVRVQVVAAETGVPIAGAHVQIRGDERSTATTDDAGWARFRGAPPVEAFPIVAAKSGWSTTRTTVGAGLAGRDPQVFHVELARAAGVAGRVVDGAGHGIANATGVAQPANAPTPIDVASDGVRTDAHGAFTLTDVAPGNIVLRAYHPEFRSGPGTAVTAQAGAAPAQITITLHHAVSVSGRVVDSDGRPAAWAELHAYVDKEPLRNDTGGRHLVADGVGEFRIDGLPNTTVRLVASTSDAASAHARHVDLSASRDVTDLVLTLELTGAISGTVVDGNHVPVAGASDTCQPVGAKRVAVRCPGFAVTDATGAFHLGGLGDGSYKLVAMRDAGSHPAAEVVARTGDTAVQLVTGATGSIAGRLRFSDGCVPGGAHVELGEIAIDRGTAIDGIVVDEAGAIVAGARVIAGSNLGSIDLGETLGVHLDAATATTDERGHFHLTGVPAGVTAIVADHRHRGRSSPTPPTATPMTLVLPPGASHEGSVAGADPKHRCFVPLDAQ